jgi:hypothetical protein
MVESSALLEAVDGFDGLFEVAASDSHDEVDGVVVFLAGEAPGEVGLGIGGRIELGAYWTEETEIAIDDLAGDAQEIGDESGDGDVVSEAAEFFIGVSRRHAALLWQMDFGHGVGDQVIIDFVYVACGGVEQASSGNVVDESWDAGGVVMDEGFGFGGEDLFMTSGGLHSVVDVGGGLVPGERGKMRTDGDSVKEVPE